MVNLHPANCSKRQYTWRLLTITVVVIIVLGRSRILFKLNFHHKKNGLMAKIDPTRIATGQSLSSAEDLSLRLKFSLWKSETTKRLGYQRIFGRRSSGIMSKSIVYSTDLIWYDFFCFQNSNMNYTKLDSTMRIQFYMCLNRSLTNREKIILKTTFMTCFNRMHKRIHDEGLLRARPIHLFLFFLFLSLDVVVFLFSSCRLCSIDILDIVIIFSSLVYFVVHRRFVCLSYICVWFSLHVRCACDSFSFTINILKRFRKSLNP
jgi:hypothetical protein